MGDFPNIDFFDMLQEDLTGIPYFVRSQIRSKKLEEFIKDKLRQEFDNILVYELCGFPQYFYPLSRQEVK